MKTTEFNAIVLANGSYPTHPLAESFLKSSLYTVCCDGAANQYIEHGLIPDLIIGDGDSLSDENKTRFAHLFHHVGAQTTNDLTKAVHYLARKRKTNNILILGATGEREDHTLANISLLMEYMHLKSGARVTMMTDHGIFTPASHSRKFDSYPGQQVSIFNFGSTHLGGRGLVYPLRTFTAWWQGTLNESKADIFTINSDGDYLVFQAF